MTPPPDPRNPIEPLIADLVHWLAREPRPYGEVMEAWRTSCPRLTVWEDAVDRGFVATRREDGGVMVRATDVGVRWAQGRSGL